jgi:hypothetical protein
MKTLHNIKIYKADQIFNMTGFNYDIKEIDNGNGTQTMIFDCVKDCDKFENLIKELEN